MSQIKTTSFEGDVSVGRNHNVGGDSTVRGKSLVKGNLKVEGWLDARNIKAPCKGWFLTEGRLLEAYPEPNEGWYALVGPTLPAQLYRADENKTWQATGQMAGEPHVDVNFVEIDSEGNLRIPGYATLKDVYTRTYANGNTCDLVYQGAEKDVITQYSLHSMEGKKVMGIDLSGALNRYYPNGMIADIIPTRELENPNVNAPQYVLYNNRGETMLAIDSGGTLVIPSYDKALQPMQASIGELEGDVGQIKSAVGDVSSKVNAVQSYIEGYMTDWITSIDQNQVTLNKRIEDVKSRIPAVPFVGILQANKDPFKLKDDPILEDPDFHEGVWYSEKNAGFVYICADGSYKSKWEGCESYGEFEPVSTAQDAGIYVPFDHTIWYNLVDFSLYVYHDDRLFRHTIHNIKEYLTSEINEISNQYRMLLNMYGGISERLIEVEQHLGLL